MSQPVPLEEARNPAMCLPVREILARIGDKWTVVVLGVLGERRLRFKELHRAIGNISQRVMTQTLRNLERDGLLLRFVYPTVPPRVEYELSERGLSLKKTLEPIGVWVRANQHDIEESRKRFDAQAEIPAVPTLTKW